MVTLRYGRRLARSGRSHVSHAYCSRDTRHSPRKDAGKGRFLMEFRVSSLPITAFSAAVVSVVLIAASLAQDTAASWPLAGHDLANSRSQPAETNISPANVG